MSDEKPENIDEYKIWLDRRLGIKEGELKRHQTYFDSISVQIRHKFEESTFWKEFQLQIRDWNDEYFSQTGYQLLAEGKIDLLIKSYDSFLLKTFRKNVLENKNWPEPPNEGWFVPDNWIFRIKDIVRTLVVVKYLDGVDFLVGKLDSLQKQCDSCSGMDVSFEAREHGYYAAHLGVLFSTDIYNIDFTVSKSSINIEIQIATQLQDVIRKLTHNFYETRREKDRSVVSDRAWQWNYGSPEFVPNYLGHLLHFVEGMIMEIRNKGDTG